ncbi:unnamed protein product [Malus baccata var. baccata]
MKLLKKLYEQEVSDDDVNVSDCGLQDFSLMPLLDALHADKTFAMDEALLLTESLFSQNSEFVKLDFSKCKVTSNYIHRLSTDSSMICGIVELNLSENPITEKRNL